MFLTNKLNKRAEEVLWIHVNEEQMEKPNKLQVLLVACIHLPEAWMAVPGVSV